MKSDSAWKDILEALFPEFLEFFFPLLYREIDWEKGFVFLDKELQKIIRSSRTGKRIVDKLVKVVLINGEEKVLLIHIEIQGSPEKNFAERMFIYNYRIFDKLRNEVITLAILSDDNPRFRENTYRVSRAGFELFFKFPIIKLIDFKGKEDELATFENPFAIVVRTFLKTLDTQGATQERYSWKKSFLLELYQRGLSRETIWALYKFIDWIMILPSAMEKVIFDELIKFEEKQKMPYITNAERIGIRKGRKEGLQKGLQRGLQKGLRQGLQGSIRDILELKFGDAGLQIFNRIQSIRDIETLELIRQRVKEAHSLEEITSLLDELENN